MKASLHWNPLRFQQSLLPADHIIQGEYIRLVISRSHQLSFIQQMYAQHKQWKIWITIANQEHQKGSRIFNRNVHSMICNHGLITNLSIRENLLLPFLYHENKQQQQQAKDEVTMVAEYLGIAKILDTTIREHEVRIDALISLGRCLLLKPKIMIAQEIHLGIPPEYLKEFEYISLQAIQQLGSGLLYLTSTATGGYHLDYKRTLNSTHITEQERK